ncbi:M-phase inducer phosphatase [Elsinoe australis]|uniref:M-phase inducer phosphatase n=1 Tax=Elsinoe australis TaxID=40998 RepID=A0A4V6DV50_9PEZI|nr:M-phase inducer phosphatase [Elsinoe australis]
MEFSSPLAAMHPPPCPTWGGRRDLPASRLMYSGSQTLAPNNFDFRNMSMYKGKHDYFSSRPARGSSPTASLAADLSSNFHIDQSPQIPTPRRSLFAKNLFQPENNDFLVTPPVDHEGATTPPIPSSSPGIDLMDISPLPHKAPCFIARVTLPSPSPEVTPVDDEEDALTPRSASHQDVPMGPPRMDFPMQMVLPERKKPTLQRPPLLRPKTFNATSAPVQPPSKEALLPPFQFGNGAPTLTSASTPNLLDTMIDSPMEEQKPSFLSTHHVPRRPSLGTTNRCGGSPVGGVSRKPVAGPHRPRKQVRRSLSMFQHPEDFMRDREDYEPPVPSLAPSPQVDNDYKHKLPHSQPDEPDSLPRIQQDTLINVLNGEYNAHYDKVLVVDCRFEYEYEGGHIEGAINYNDKELLARELFVEAPPPRTLLIFHCEYSVHRAPRMAKFVRNRDRAVNDFQYPKLTYPEMYILDGGYSQFFKLHRTKCFPQNYVEMEHKDHEQACEKGMGKLKQRAKLSRAQTFAFGTQSCQMEDSPTSGYGSRMSGRSYSALDSHDISPMLARQFTRRLATA